MSGLAINQHCRTHLKDIARLLPLVFPFILRGKVYRSEQRMNKGKGKGRGGVLGRTTTHELLLLGLRRNLLMDCSAIMPYAKRPMS